MAAGWRFDELAHAGAEHLDPSYVAGYDRKSGDDPVDDVAVLQSRGLGPNWTVVDLGAGTGRFTLAVAPHCARVIAVDVSAPMLAALDEAAGPAAAGRQGAAIDLVRAGFLTYEHDGPPADAVYSRNALHHLPDFWKAVALERLAGILRPGGVLRLRDLIYDFAASEADAAIEEWIDGGVTDPADGWTGDELAEHVRTEHSTFRWLLEPMLDRAGLDVVDVAFRRRVYGSYTCIRR